MGHPMHGILFSEFKKYFVERAGGAQWGPALQEAGLGNKVYLPNQIYADQELVSLVVAASKRTGRSPAALLEDFGEYIAPHLLALYRAQINPEWKSLDVVEKTEQLVHTAVRLRMPGADPPHLRCTRTSPSQVVMEYDSPRRLCPVAKGITRGVGRHLKENLRLTETTCMLEGGSQCRIVIDRMP